MDLIESNSIVQSRPSPIQGVGLFALRNIAAGERVIEYSGERISSQEMLLRCQAGNFFIFALGDGDYLDGSVETNLAKWINHSCDPNCEILWENGRIWIVAKKEICAEEEITFNYSYDLEDYRQHPCNCGAAECVGFIVAEEFFEHVRARALSKLEKREWDQTLRLTSDPQISGSVCLLTAGPDGKMPPSTARETRAAT